MPTSTLPALEADERQFVEPPRSSVWTVSLDEVRRGALVGLLLGPFATTLYTGWFVDPLDAILIGVLVGLPVGALVGALSGADPSPRAHPRSLRLPVIITSGVIFLLLVRVPGETGVSILACIVAPAVYMLGAAVARLFGWGFRRLWHTFGLARTEPD